jgi:hypothetical protein
MPAETAAEPIVEKGPSRWPLLVVLGFFLAALIGAAGTTGAAVAAHAAHASPHHGVHQKIYLVSTEASSGNRP